MSLPLRRRNTEGRDRVPSVKQLRETVRIGPAAAFNFGFTLPDMSMAQIAAQDEPEWASRNVGAQTRHRLPLPLRRVDLGGVALDTDLAAIRAALSGPDAHTARMLLLPHAARIAELLGSTWDRRPAGVSVGRELGEATL